MALHRTDLAVPHLLGSGGGPAARDHAPPAGVVDHIDPRIGSMGWAVGRWGPLLGPCSLLPTALLPAPCPAGLLTG